MTRVVLVLVGLLAFASTASAQAVTQYRLSIYIQGAAQPTTTATLAASAFDCGEAIVNPPSGTVNNPSRVRIADPANPSGLDCVYTDPGNGPLLGLPFNPTVVYDATIRAESTGGNSAESTRSNPFARPGSAPTAPGRLRIGGSN